MSTSKPLILFVHQSAELYGSDRVLLYLVKGILDAGEFHPLVVVPEAGALVGELQAAGIETHIGEVAKVSRAMFSPVGIFRLLDALRRSVRDIDAILAGRRVAVVHSNTLAVLGGAAWARWRRTAHVWHVHEILLKPRLIGRAFPVLVRLFADEVMSNSVQTEQWLLREQPKLAPRSVVVFNGLPAVQQPVTAAIQAFRTQVGAGADDIVVTLVGRLNWWKGQALLIDAIANLHRADKLGRLRIAIVGDTAAGQEALRDGLKAQVVDAGLDGRIVFLPFVNDIWPVWFGSDIAVVPSTQPEPFGMVAIEAMAASLPVICAGHGGLLDIVEHEKTGLQFAPGQVDELAAALLRLAGNADERRRLGAAGRARQVDVFSVAAQVDRTQRVYRELTACPQ